MTTRIVDVGSGNLLPGLTSEDSSQHSLEPYENILWMNILRSQSAYQMYMQHVQEIVNAKDVVEFLIKNPDFPRSVFHNLEDIKAMLKTLPRHGKASTQVNKALRAVRSADIAALLEKGLLEHIDLMQIEIGQIHDKIAQTWFLPQK